MNHMTISKDSKSDLVHPNWDGVGNDFTECHKILFVSYNLWVQFSMATNRTNMCPKNHSMYEKCSWPTSHLWHTGKILNEVLPKIDLWAIWSRLAFNYLNIKLKSQNWNPQNFLNIQRDVTMLVIWILFQ